MCEFKGRLIKRPRVPHKYQITFGMALLSDDDQLICAFTGCRDMLHDYLKTAYSDGVREATDIHVYYPKAGDPRPCLDELRLVIQTSAKTGMKGIRHALKQLNAFERYADIPETTGEIVEFEDPRSEETNAGLVLLTGSKEYLQIPQLLSSLSLLFRFSTFNMALGDIDPEAPQPILRKLKNAMGVADGFMLRQALPLMPHILKNRVEIFEGQRQEDLFKMGLGGRYHGCAGIVALCRQESLNKTLNLRIKALRKKCDIYG